MAFDFDTFYQCLGSHMKRIFFIGSRIVKSILKTLPILFMTAILVGCGTTTQISARLDREIIIDGNLADWPSLTEGQTHSKVLLRSFDDGKFLYLSLLVKDPRYTRTIVAGGLTTWLNPQGDKQKAFGVVFPVGMGDLDYRRKDVDRKLRNPQAFYDLMKVMTEDLKIINMNGETKRINLEDLRDGEIKAQASCTDNGFAYEMKIPLEDFESSDGSVVSGKNRVIGLGLDAPGMAADPKTSSDTQDKNMGEGPQSGNPPSGEMKPQGGRGHGRMGPKSVGREPNGSDNVAGFKKLKAWLKIVLSSSKPSQ